MYIPNKHVAIDEKLLFLKGRLGFWQYILNKRTWFEIKMFSLCGVTGTALYMSGKMLQKQLKKKPWQRTWKKWCCSSKTDE